MNDKVAVMLALFLAVNVAAMFLLVVMSFVGSTVALDWLEKVDTWMRHKDEERP